MGNGKQGRGRRGRVRTGTGWEMEGGWRAGWRTDAVAGEGLVYLLNGDLLHGVAREAEHGESVADEVRKKDINWRRNSVPGSANRGMQQRVCGVAGRQKSRERSRRK